MATFTSALALYKHQIALFARANATAKQMHRHMAAEAWKDARELTSGTVGPRGSARKRWLARNRPFARRRIGLKPGTAPGGKLSLLPVGVITGRLYAGWRLRTISSGGAIQRFALSNSAPYAKHILGDGTRTMIGRGFKKEIRKSHTARNKAFKDTLRARIRARH